MTTFALVRFTRGGVRGAVVLPIASLERSLAFTSPSFVIDDVLTAYFSGDLSMSAAAEELEMDRSER